MGLFVLNILLALAWGAVIGSFEPPTLMLGYAMGMLSIWLLRGHWGSDPYFIRLFRLVKLAGLFLLDLVTSSVKVARVVLTPGFAAKPGIISVPLRVETPAQITLLANMITLTPGTLSLDVTTDQKRLYIHAMEVADPEELRAEIRDGFERRIIETFADKAATARAGQARSDREGSS
ncbi:MAG: Na+/H+ antiporter subunit E [Alphaproteobacteria bacterium]